MGFDWIAPALDILRRRYFGGPSAAVAGEIAWSRVVAAALPERLGAPLAEAVATLDIDLPDRCWATLTAARLTNRQVVARNMQSLDELASELERAGIRPVIFKGPALSRHYPDPTVRQASDIDLLVAPDWMGQIDQLLQRSGYRPSPEIHATDRRAHPVMYTPLRGAPDDGTVLDVHPRWHEVRLTSDGRRVRVADAEMELDEARIGARRWRVLPPVVELHLAAAHSVLHSPRTLSVYLDLAVLLQNVGLEGLQVAYGYAQAHGRERHLRHGVSLAAELFGLEVPRRYRTRAARLRVPISLRLGYVGSRTRYVPSALVLELLWRRGVRRKTKFLRWVLAHGTDGIDAADPGGLSLRRVVRGLRWLWGGFVRYDELDQLSLRS